MTVFLSSGLGKRKSRRDVSNCDGARSRLRFSLRLARRTRTDRLATCGD
jgi:2-polyprenyl-6-methoxyphenol hydroxylase-like FAD-dependent oxidoreductase